MVRRYEPSELFGLNSDDLFDSEIDIPDAIKKLRATSSIKKTSSTKYHVVTTSFTIEQVVTDFKKKMLRLSQSNKNKIIEDIRSYRINDTCIEPISDIIYELCLKSIDFIPLYIETIFAVETAQSQKILCQIGNNAYKEFFEPSEIKTLNKLSCETVEQKKERIQLATVTIISKTWKILSDKQEEDKYKRVVSKLSSSLDVRENVVMLTILVSDNKECLDQCQIDKIKELCEDKNISSVTRFLLMDLRDILH